MSSPAVSSGVKFGLIVGALAVVSNILSVVFTQSVGAPPTAGDTAAAQAYLQRAAPELALLFLVGLVIFVVNIILYLMSGRSAAKQTGTVGSGAVAGLITGIIGGIVGAVLSIGFNAAGLSTSPSNTAALGASTLVAVAIGAAIVGLAIDAGIGAGLGALGGLMGRSAYQKANAATMPMGIPGSYPPPPGGYPPQPMQ